MIMSSPADRAYLAGRFLEALEVLARDPQTRRASVLYSELLQLTGQSERAAALAAQVLDEADRPFSDRARAAAVIAMHSYDQGDSVRALDYWQRALVFAEQADDAALVSTVTGQLLERSCDLSGFDSSLP